ncbi:hypothetical protein D3C83_65530 [compost metagenome]
MIDRRRERRFLNEPLAPDRIADEIGGDELDRRLALELQVFGEIHLAHAAGAKALEEPIVANRVAQHGEPRL